MKNKPASVLREEVDAREMASSCWGALMKHDWKLEKALVVTEANINTTWQLHSSVTISLVQDGRLRLPQVAHRQWLWK